MAKRYRRNPQELITDLQQRISELEKKQQILNMGKDPAVRSMRLVRMYLRTAVGSMKGGSPLPAELGREATAFLDVLDHHLVRLGARKARRRRKGAAS
jgi:hypothetical protein